MAAGFNTAEMLGRRALPAFCMQGSPVQLTSCEFALHQFQPDGTGVMEDVGAKIDSRMLPAAGFPGEAFNWAVTGVAKPGRVQSGTLKITTASASATYWRIDMGDAATNLLVFVARARDGADTLAAAGQTLMINGGNPVGFAEIGPVGTWRYGTWEQSYQPYVYDADIGQAPSTVRFVRGADGTEIQKYWRTDNPSDPAYIANYYSGWQLADGRLYDTRYHANVSSSGSVIGFYSCAQAYASGATLCAPRRVRYFRPLAAVGNRLYGIEDLYLKRGTSYVPPYPFDRDSRPNYYEKLTP
ncbi:MAG: hypothetical protein H0X25_18325 [Acidobacteriales bacterium]|nr:hypothetical protein [Terriglobales bacterium]